MKRRPLRRGAALALVLSFLLLVTACGASPAPGSAKEDGRLQVVCTIFPPYDFVREIAGGEADVTMLLKPGEESHSYEPTPADIRAIAACDLFIYTGGENDTWVDRILDSFGDDAPRTIRLTDLVETVDEAEEGIGEHHDESEAAEQDEHVWTSPQNAMTIVSALADAMAEEDPAHAALYQAGAESYIRELTALDEELHEIVRTGKRNVIIVGDRFPFRYLADELGLEHFAAYPGCSANAEVSAGTVVWLTERARELQAPVVFSVDLSNGEIANAVSEVTGARRRNLWSLHTITRTQLQSGATYLSLMHENAEALREALN
jgi:zinc transport system substrate-binding protein